LPTAVAWSGAGPAHFRDAAHGQRALDVVERDRFVPAGHRQRDGLLDPGGQFLEVRAGEGADVQPLARGARQADDADAEAVAPGGGDVLDEAAAHQGRQDPGDRAHVDAGAPGDLVGSELRPGVGELGEDRDRPLDGGDLAGGWLTGSGHDRIPVAMEILFPSGQ
jgi:hypothetical protein